ncbi:unnamed protein product, partial [Polarella glacialis]
VWLDVSTLSVVRYDPAFTLISGPFPEGQMILNHMKGARKFERDLQNWLQCSAPEVDAQLRMAETGSTEAVMRTNMGSLCFRFPAMKKAGIEFESDVTLEFPLASLSGGDAVVKMSLSKVRMRPTTAKKTFSALVRSAPMICL